MVGSESRSPANLRGTPNFYRVMLFLSLILLVLLPLCVLSSDVWLESREKRLQAEAGALEAELQSLSQQIAADQNEVAALDTEASEIAHSEQVFTEGSDQRSLWRPDARWSEMGKARVQEIWRQRGTLGDRLAQSRGLVWQKEADLIRMGGRKDQIAYLRQFIKRRTFVLYGVVLFGAFAVAVFALMWGVLQGRVNAILRRWI
jgi:hypothetical protein